MQEVAAMHLMGVMKSELSFISCDIRDALVDCFGEDLVNEVL